VSQRSSGRESKRKVDKQIALALQGGGALGSYQAGVYEALAEHDYRPDWVAGVSIGAINCAIIAGNASQERVARLREFWEKVSSPSADWLDLPLDIWRNAMERTAAISALVFGQPGFFRPNDLRCWVAGSAPTSYYDTSDLKGTLERLVDFDRINARETRLSVGAVNVRTGNYDTLAFQVDLFSARGIAPKDLDAVSERDKDIRYSSRTRMGVETFRYAHNLRRNISLLLAKLPDALKGEPEVEFLKLAACQTTMDIVELIYRPQTTQGPAKDYEFSRATMERRWQHGLDDARATLASSPWLEPAPAEIAVRTFDVVSDRSATRMSRVGADR